MKSRLLNLCALALVGSAAACTGTVSEPGSAPGTGSHPGSGGSTSNAGSGGNGNPGSGGSGSPGSGGSANSGSGGGNPGSGGSGNPGSGGGTTLVAKPVSLDGSPQYYRFVRLTNSQWARSVQDILNLAAPSGLESGFETAVAGTTDFSNNELLLDVSQSGWSDYQTAAETLAAQVTTTDAALQNVYTGTDAAGFIKTFGRRAYRRPLTAAEASSYMAIYTTGSTMSGTQSAFTKGAALVIRTMLQSPYFLYRSELAPTGGALNAYEIAAKLSLWLRGTTPSDALLDSAAGPGKLDTADGAVALATTMLEEPAATAVMRDFHNQLLQFDRYTTVDKIGVPNYTDALNDEFLQSSYLFFDKIFTQGLGVRDILTSTSGFMGPGMAALYGMTPLSSGFAEHDLGASRVGYFSQIPYLALYGVNLQPDSIHRGVKINLDILCVDPGAPAANIPPIPDLVPGETNRQLITTLTGTCGAQCHGSYINPIGFAFENFDGMGQLRATDNGQPVDTSGVYPFAEAVTSFVGAPDLMRAMANGAQAHECYAKKLASFALQRDIVAADLPLLDALKNTSMASGGSVKQVMLDLVRNDAFRMHTGGVQ